DVRRGRHRPPGGPAGRHRHRAAVGRGVRAHRVRRATAPVGAVVSGAARARLRRLQLRQDLPLHRLEGRLLHRATRAVGRVPQGAPVQHLLHLHPGPARVRGDARAGSGALRGPRRLLPGQARPLPRAARDHAAAAAAGAGRLLPAGGLFGGERPGRRGVLPVAHDRAWRGGDPPVALLRRSAGGTTPGAAVLRQERGHARRRHRAAVATVAAMDDLRVSLVQGATRWHDPAANLAYYGGLSAPLRGTTDLVLLPETFTSGFSNDAIDRAETMDGPTVAWLRELAAALDAAVCGSVQLRAGGEGGDVVFNRLLFATPDGGLRHYDKRHLFRYAGEHERYAAGRERLVRSEEHTSE